MNAHPEPRKMKTSAGFSRKHVHGYADSFYYLLQTHVVHHCLGPTKGGSIAVALCSGFALGKGTQ